MEKGKLVAGGLALIVVQFLITSGIFVKFQDLYSYAVSKDSFDIVLRRLDNIERKQDLILEKIK